MGGHVQFSHYAYYDRVLDQALGGRWLWHERESYDQIKNRFVPYPFQNNIHRLDPADRDDALAGFGAGPVDAGGEEGQAELISPPGSIRPSAAASRGCSCIPTT